jgi:hypothetical protein
MALGKMQKAKKIPLAHENFSSRYTKSKLTGIGYRTEKVWQQNYT